MDQDQRSSKYRLSSVEFPYTTTNATEGDEDIVVEAPNDVVDRMEELIRKMKEWEKSILEYQTELFQMEIKQVTLEQVQDMNMVQLSQLLIKHLQAYLPERYSSEDEVMNKFFRNMFLSSSCSKMLDELDGSSLPLFDAMSERWSLLYEEDYIDLDPSS